MLPYTPPNRCIRCRALEEDWLELNGCHGVRNAGRLLCKYDLEDWRKRDDISLNVTIDSAVPGWTELVGFVLAVLKEVALSSDNAIAIVYGSPMMIKFTMPVVDELGFQPEDVLLSLR